VILPTVKNAERSIADLYERYGASARRPDAK
jgi:hypothetical protein